MMKKMLFVSMAFLLFILGACSSSSPTTSSNTTSQTSGEGYPTRPVTVYVQYSAGGSTDLAYRQFMAVAEKYLGQSIVVQNVEGGGGTVGLAKLATEKPDGYILGNTSLQPITITPHNQTVTYTPEDFRYIGGWGKYLYGIAVKADSPYQTYEDFINASRKSPGLTYSDPGPGGITTLAMQMLEKAEGGVTQWKSVPFQGGGEATASLLGGHVDFNINNPGAVASGLQSGSIKLLASVSDSRWEIAPDAPTIRELGYDFDLTSWLAIGGPKGLPDEVVEVWSDVIQKTIADPEFIEAAKKMDLPLDWMPGDEYEDLVINMYDEFGALIEASKN